MKRTEQREHIFKLVFGAEFNAREELDRQITLYLKQREISNAEDRNYIMSKVCEIVSRISQIDALINEHATGWKTERMNKADLSILRLAVYEMRWDTDVPVSVAINEAVELAKKYSGEEGPAFVNGVLAKLAE